MKKKILIADDEPGFAESLGQLFRIHGFDSVVVNDGERCLEAAVNEHPDLVLLDLVMPKIHGWEVAGRLCGNQATCDVPVILLTASETYAKQACDLKNVAGRVLTKPFPFDELLRIVRGLLLK
ncbi:MAG: response regulator [Candidatus Omnitrophica bacterium]|nr:response regulator [Candidatus Omnitrophota bacterium]